MQVDMDENKDGWALGVKFDMHQRRLPFVALYTSSDMAGLGAELVAGESPTAKLVKKRLKRALKELSKDDNGFFLKAVPKEVSFKCDAQFDQGLEEAEKKATAEEEKAIRILRGPQNRTRIGLVALATGETWGGVGVKWLASANRHFCTDRSKYELFLVSGLQRHRRVKAHTNSEFRTNPTTS